MGRGSSPELKRTPCCASQRANCRDDCLVFGCTRDESAAAGAAGRAAEAAGEAAAARATESWRREQPTGVARAPMTPATDCVTAIALCLRAAARLIVVTPVRMAACMLAASLCWNRKQCRQVSGSAVSASCTRARCCSQERPSWRRLRRSVLQADIQTHVWAPRLRWQRRGAAASAVHGQLGQSARKALLLKRRSQLHRGFTKVRRSLRRASRCWTIDRRGDLKDAGSSVSWAVQCVWRCTVRFDGAAPRWPAAPFLLVSTVRGSRPHRCTAGLLCATAGEPSPCVAARRCIVWCCVPAVPLCPACCALVVCAVSQRRCYSAPSLVCESASVAALACTLRVVRCCLHRIAGCGSLMTRERRGDPADSDRRSRQTDPTLVSRAARTRRPAARGGCRLSGEVRARSSRRGRSLQRGPLAFMVPRRSDCARFPSLLERASCPAPTVLLWCAWSLLCPFHPIEGRAGRRCIAGVDRSSGEASYDRDPLQSMRPAAHSSVGHPHC